MRIPEEWAHGWQRTSGNPSSPSKATNPWLSTSKTSPIGAKTSLILVWRVDKAAVGVCLHNVPPVSVAFSNQPFGSEKLLSVAYVDDACMLRGTVAYTYTVPIGFMSPGRQSSIVPSPHTKRQPLRFGSRGAELRRAGGVT